MVLLHVKTAEERNQFLFETRTQELVSTVTAQIVELHLTRLRALKVAEAAEALATFGPLRPEETRGLTEEVRGEKGLPQFLAFFTVSSSAHRRPTGERLATESGCAGCCAFQPGRRSRRPTHQPRPQPLPHRSASPERSCRSYQKNLHRSRRKTLAQKGPRACMRTRDVDSRLRVEAPLRHSSVGGFNARRLCCDSQAERREPLGLAEVKEGLELLGGAIQIAYPAFHGLPSWEPARALLEGGEASSGYEISEARPCPTRLLRRAAALLPPARKARVSASERALSSEYHGRERTAVVDGKATAARRASLQVHGLKRKDANRRQTATQVGR